MTGAIVGGPRRGAGGRLDRRGRVPLTDADLDEIAAAIEATGAGGGPVRPV